MKKLFALMTIGCFASSVATAQVMEVQPTEAEEVIDCSGIEMNGGDAAKGETQCYIVKCDPPLETVQGTYLACMGVIERPGFGYTYPDVERNTYEEAEAVPEANCLNNVLRKIAACYGIPARDCTSYSGFCPPY